MDRERERKLLEKLDPYGEPYGQSLLRYFVPTQKEDPADAELVSHKLMIRAGLIRKLAGGIYSYLPFMLRSMRKLERIIRSALNTRGAQELLLPAVQPYELWRESGRDKKYGPELLRLKDRHDRDFVIGPTHEEVITDIIRHEIHSFRDLPLNLYQIQTKFRDEIRPRFGVMRGREFIMKDAYSFDEDEDSAGKSYQDMYDAYTEIFSRCGLNFATVEADSGAIGGSYSHEFMVLAESGENNLVFCNHCSYAANQEKAELLSYKFIKGQKGTLEKVYTPNCRHVDQLAKFLKVPEATIIKSMLFIAEDNSPYLVLIPGHREINTIKLQNALNGVPMRLAEPNEAESIMGVPMGFVTPVGAKVPIIADNMIKEMAQGVVGTGEKDYHFIGAAPGRDFTVHSYFDLALATEGDPCPRCGGELSFKKGIEVGHVFKLGTKYSEALGAKVTRKDGSETPIIMGCYGIGIGRTIAASIEQSHDKDGIIWPVALSPFEVALIPLQVQNDSLMEKTYKLFNELIDATLEVLIDDRDERPGKKFKDADLLGLPYRVTVSEKSLAKDECELKERASGKITMLPIASASEYLKALRDKALN
ncbi:MAG: proline--tRNA ligase [Deltaproteobacteria bacterium]|jgi:prolyl-tRNA synthetase|nr:proline--tRNA ligase [Deltaproteobacteria bacterium]